MQSPQPLFTYYRLALLLLAGLAACTLSPVEPVAPAGSAAPQVRVGPLAQGAKVRQTLGHLAQAFPVSAQARQQVRPGFVPSAWGLVDTTRVLRVLSPSGKAHYTFRLHGINARLGTADGFSRLLLYEAGNGFKGLLLYYIPAPGWRPQQPFSGQLSIQDLQGQLVSNLALHNGQPVGASRAVANGRSMEGQSCLQDINWHQDCSEGEVSTATGVALPVDLQNCMWVLELDYGVCDASTVGAPGEAAGSPGTTLGPGGGGSGGSGSVIIEEPPAEDPETPEPLYTGPVLDLQELMLDQWVEHIDDSELAECLKNVLNDLKTLRSDLADVINMFNESNTYYNWTVKSAPAVDEHTFAVTGSKNYDDCQCATTTVFIDNLKNGSDLGIAVVLLHEIIHAHLRIKFYVDEEGFELTYPEYIQEYNKNKNWAQAQHNEFTRSFVNKLGETLKSYGELKGYSLSEYYYKKLAWHGLYATDAYNELDVLMRYEIQDIASIETRAQNRYGNPKQPKGVLTNCN